MIKSTKIKRLREKDKEPSLIYNESLEKVYLINRKDNVAIIISSEIEREIGTVIQIDQYDYWSRFKEFDGDVTLTNY